MPNFIIRIQLTQESTTLYTFLRNELLKIGFSKRIKSKEGVEYRLPNGNYLINSNKNINEITNAVKKVALLVDKNAMILVIETQENGTSWSGLERC